MRDLEAGGLSRMDRTAQRLEGFHKERAHEIRLEPAGLSFLHLILHGEKALRAHRFLRESVAIEDVAKFVAIEGILNALAETGADFGLIAVTDGLKEQILQADAFEDLAKNVEDTAIEGLALNTKFFKKPKIYIAFPRFLGDKIPQMADFLLTDAVDAAKALFQAVRIPRQVVVHHQVGVLKIHAFTGGIGCDQNSYFGVGTKDRLNAAALITVGPAVDGDDRVSIAQHSGNFLVQVVQCVAVLREDDELALAAASIAHGRIVLQDAGEFIPFTVFPGNDDCFGLMF